MKHNLKITLILILVFLVAQIIGITTYSLSLNTQIIDGTIRIDHDDTLLGETPELEDEEKSLSFLPIIIAILIGTAILFLLIKFKLDKVWRYWFLLAVIITMSLSFEVYIGTIAGVILALILGIIKVFKPNVFVHNISEIFIYTGIVIIIAPLLNLFSGILLLVAISIYDMIAVWKSKHMIKLAEFQTKSKLFAGLLVPYHKESKKSHKKISKLKKSSTVKNAILGGGDIAFPLLFTATVFEALLLKGVEKIIAFSMSLSVILGSTVALGFLLIYGKKDRYYPAMPYISAGCLAGLAMAFLLFKTL